MVKPEADSGPLTSRSTHAAEGIVVDKPVKLSIASDPSAVRVLQDRVLQEMTRLGYDQQSHFAVKLALEESLINAIKHGNAHDPRKKVQIEYRINASQVEISIEDEGAASNARAFPILHWKKISKNAAAGASCSSKLT